MIGYDSGQYRGPYNTPAHFQTHAAAQCAINIQNISLEMATEKIEAQPYKPPICPNSPLVKQDKTSVSHGPATHWCGAHLI